MSKFENLNIGDMIVITGLNENLFECNDEHYDTLLSVMNQPCTIVDDGDDVDLYQLIDDNKNPHLYCVERPQKGFLIKSPKLQGHDGGGKCPEYNCFWIGEDYVSFESMSYDETADIFNKLNESDEFGWAEEIVKDTPNVVDYRTVKQGDKVVSGKDWMFGNQAQGSIYGIVDLEEYDGEPQFIEDSTDEEFWQYWVHVDWVNKNGELLFRNNYRVGPDYHDLKYYTPKPVKKKKIKESEDEFGWAEDVVNQEEISYGTVLPYLDDDDIISITGDFTNDLGDVLLSVKDAVFKVKKESLSKNTISLYWVYEDERPENSDEITTAGAVKMGPDTYEWDKDLMVKILHKEKHPF
jgi:hypothetical protein